MKGLTNDDACTDQAAADKTPEERLRPMTVIVLVTTYGVQQTRKTEIMTVETRASRHSIVAVKREQKTKNKHNIVMYKAFPLLTVKDHKQTHKQLIYNFFKPK